MNNKCLQCPHEGRDNVFCRTCSVVLENIVPLPVKMSTTMQKEYIQEFYVRYTDWFPVDFSADVKLWIACQSALETGYGKSAIYLENNNLFGMKMPKLRPTYAVSINRGHACYKHHMDSLLDYLALLFFNRITKKDYASIENFERFITKIGYCPSVTYTKTINKILHNYGGKN